MIQQSAYLNLCYNILHTCVPQIGKFLQEKHFVKTIFMDINFCEPYYTCSYKLKIVKC